MGSEISEPYCDYKIFEAIVREVTQETEKPGLYFEHGDIKWPALFSDILLALRLKQGKINVLEEKKTVEDETNFTRAKQIKRVLAGRGQRVENGRLIPYYGMISGRQVMEVATKIPTDPLFGPILRKDIDSDALYRYDLKKNTLEVA